MTLYFPLLLLALLTVFADAYADSNEPYMVVLGIAQDGGVPQIGKSTHPAWRDESLRRSVVSLALVDPLTEQRWLFEATPDIREQLYQLDQIAPVPSSPGLNGIFLTHAHMGHYTGLMQLGHEALGTKKVPVHVMPRFARYLKRNGPWSQLVRYKNIALRKMADGKSIQLNPRLTVTPFLVPHRQEFSEVVGFRIDGPEFSVLFLPDIDSWETWDEQGTRIEDIIADVDVAYLDATFYSDTELPGRDMSGFPHPFIKHSMDRFAPLPASERSKVRFIHFNHTNPALVSGSDAQKAIAAAGHKVAKEMERINLGSMP